MSTKTVLFVPKRYYIRIKFLTFKKWLVIVFFFSDYVCGTDRVSNGIEVLMMTW